MNAVVWKADLRPSSPTYGAVAVRFIDGVEWGVMQRGTPYNPRAIGGSFVREEQLAGWTELTPVVDI